MLAQPMMQEGHADIQLAQRLFSQYMLSAQARIPAVLRSAGPPPRLRHALMFTAGPLAVCGFRLLTISLAR